MLHDVVSTLFARWSGPPCFQVYGRGRDEVEWHVLDVYSTHRRNATSCWPLWRGTCITWTSRVIAVGYDFAALVLAEQMRSPATRINPVEVAGGRLCDRHGRVGATRRVAASEVLAHEIGHTAQARRLGLLYWPLGGAVTLFREGPHWWNRFENQASETGLFGGIVAGSVDDYLIRLVPKSQRFNGA